MTYRIDSDIFCPYDTLLPIKNDVNIEDVWKDSEVDSIIQKKRLPILWFVTHCQTDSGREKHVNELRRYIDVTQFGKCNDKECDEKCENNQIEEHFFYLSFENSVCDDYITEKFWRMKKLIVPIVLSRKAAENIVPNQYFIALDDFNNTFHLVENLQFLMKNTSLYKKYLSWYKYYKKTITPFGKTLEDCFCRLCGRISKPSTNQIMNIKEWWEDKAECKAYNTAQRSTVKFKSYSILCLLSLYLYGFYIE
uniref:Fucosyltransferase n=1 Tax=Acrobeloides nanus TaxID=290746 RepID=A0A914E0H6_9BILA